MSIYSLVYVIAAAYVMLGAAFLVVNKELDDKEAKLKKELFYPGATK